MTPGLMTPGASVGPPAPQTPRTRTPRTPSPVWELLGDPEEQEQAESQTLPLYLTAGHAAFDSVAASGAGAADNVATVSTSPANGDAAAHPPVAAVVAAVAADAAGGIAASPETPGAVIRRKPPKAAPAGGKRKLPDTLSNPQGLVFSLHLDAPSSGPACAAGSNAGAITNAIAGCFEASAQGTELGEPRYPKRTRQTSETELHFAMF